MHRNKKIFPNKKKNNIFSNKIISVALENSIRQTNFYLVKDFALKC